MILSIDPGSSESAYVVLDENLKPVEFGKLENHHLKNILSAIVNKHRIKRVAVEHIASYGMAVGASVFVTCIWIGRFTETLSRHIDIQEIKEIYRKDEKINLCGSMKAKDGNIRMALIDRFAKHDFKNGKGTKSNHDWFYGFHSDIWAAYAVGCTYSDMYLNKKDVG